MKGGEEEKSWRRKDKYDLLAHKCEFTANKKCFVKIFCSLPKLSASACALSDICHLAPTLKCLNSSIIDFQQITDNFSSYTPNGNMTLSQTIPLLEVLVDTLVSFMGTILMLSYSILVTSMFGSICAQEDKTGSCPKDIIKGVQSY